MCILIWLGHFVNQLIDITEGLNRYILRYLYVLVKPLKSLLVFSVMYIFVNPEYLYACNRVVLKDSRRDVPWLVRNVL